MIVLFLIVSGPAQTLTPAPVFPEIRFASVGAAPPITLLTVVEKHMKTPFTFGIAPVPLALVPMSSRMVLFRA